MNDAFLDTVGMIAVWDDTDQWHAIRPPNVSFGRLRVAEDPHARRTTD